jgi:glucose-6-phosphate dehydrogenase assembly protein OpcA
MSTLWDTDAAEIVRLLSSERRAAGAVASGIVLTLVTVVDEQHADEAIAAATAAAMAHPCRLLVVTRRQADAQTARLDAEVVVGGRHGPGEAVVLRMYGRLCRHAESVVLPLLAPDTPVVTWWFGTPPAKPGQDPLGRLAGRRITDSAAAPDGVQALAGRAADYNPGDTDLAWTRLSPWRSILAAVFDTVGEAATKGRIEAEARNPSAALLAAWLRVRLGVATEIVDSAGPGITEVSLTLTSGAEVRITRPDGRSATLVHSGQPERAMPLPRRELGELLAEELQRLDSDEPYADALAAFRKIVKRAAAS